MGASKLRAIYSAIGSGALTSARAMRADGDGNIALRCAARRVLTVRSEGSEGERRVRVRVYVCMCTTYVCAYVKEREERESEEVEADADAEGSADSCGALQN